MICHSMERHRGRLAGKTPRCAGGCESSSTQGLVLSSVVIPICPPNGPTDYRSLLLFYGGVLKPLLHIPPDQASTAGSAAIMRAPDTRMSSRKMLSPERSLSSREHNPVPSPTLPLQKSSHLSQFQIPGLGSTTSAGKSLSLPPTLWAKRFPPKDML